MNNSILDNIKEVRMNWDWNYITIPKEELKLLKYNKIDEKVKTIHPYIKCDYVCIEINLDYLKTQYNNTEYSLLDYIQKKNIWNIEVTMQNEEIITLDLPSYRKESYFPNNYYLSMDAKNLCEKHSVSENIYKIEWVTLSKKEMWISFEELPLFFKNGILSIYYTVHEIGIELFERILMSNIQKQNLQNIDTFSMLKRILESNERTKTLYRRKLSYQVNEEYTSTDGIERIHLNFSNHSYKWNLTFLFVNSSTYNKKLDSILEQLCKPDTPHFFHRTILIFKNEKSIDEFHNTYPNLSKEQFLYTTLEEINELWYHIHDEANLV